MARLQLPTCGLRGAMLGEHPLEKGHRSKREQGDHDERQYQDGGPAAAIDEWLTFHHKFIDFGVGWPAEIICADACYSFPPKLDPDPNEDEVLDVDELDMLDDTPDVAPAALAPATWDMGR